jgi:hypothetical protein
MSITEGFLFLFYFLFFSYQVYAHTQINISLGDKSFHTREIKIAFKENWNRIKKEEKENLQIDFVKLITKNGFLRLFFYCHK